MKPFIYVFCKSDADIMIKAGYELLRSDDVNQQYIFANKATEDYAAFNIQFCVSNTLVL